MNHPVRVLCRPAVAAGFRLAGLTPLEADAADEGARQLDALVSAGETAVVLVEESFVAALPPAARRRLARQPMTVIVPFPGPLWAPPREAAEAFIADLLRQAIGYRVRLG